MRIAIVAGVLAACVAVVPAVAQTKKPAGDAVRYFSFYSDIMGALPVDGSLRETRRGNKIVSAVLDLCHSVSPTSSRKDRFVVELHADGNRLVGSGQSQEDKLPVKVDITRKASGDTVTFEGTITRGTATTDVASSDNTDMSEAEFQEGQKNETTIEANPPDFTEFGPDSLAVEIKREALPDLVKLLREQKVSVALDSLTQGCPVLRSGKQVVNITVDPQRAGALLAKLKSLSGVTAAGWREGSSSLDRAVRVPRADWRAADGGIDRDKLSATIAASVSKTLAATLQGSKWNETTGELTLNFKRPDTVLRGLGMTETIELVALVGPEKPGADQNLIIWFGDPAFQTVDEGGGGRMALVAATRGEDEGEEASSPEGDALMAALGRDLKGRLWDSDKNAWK